MSRGYTLGGMESATDKLKNFFDFLKKNQPIRDEGVQVSTNIY